MPIRKGSKIWLKFIKEVMKGNCQWWNGYRWSDLEPEMVADGELLKGMKLWKQTGNDGLFLKDEHGYKIKPKYQKYPVG